MPDTKKFSAEWKTGDNKLFNVLKAYACYDNKLGYVQGMNYLAAVLLLYIEDEVKVFWCMVSLLFRKNWREIYNDNTPKLMNLLDLVKQRLDKDDKELLLHLENEDLSMAAAFSPIFITLFIYQVPL